MLVAYGYSSPAQLVTLEELQRKATWALLHPEVQRRLLRLLVAADGRVGLGQGWRTSSAQRAEFLARHVVVATGGCCVYEGKRFALRPGMSPIAPPGNSFHEGVMGGLAGAADLIGDLTWVGIHAHEFGLVDFSDTNNEPWHVQCAELPKSVDKWIAAGRPEPTDTTPPPAPPPAVPDPVDPPEEDDMPGPAIVAIYKPAFPQATPSHKWFGLLADGSVRQVAGPDVAYAAANGAVTYAIEGPEHYAQLDAMDAVWRGA